MTDYHKDKSVYREERNMFIVELLVMRPHTRSLVQEMFGRPECIAALGTSCFSVTCYKMKRRAFVPHPY